MQQYHMQFHGKSSFKNDSARARSNPELNSSSTSQPYACKKKWTTSVWICKYYSPSTVITYKLSIRSQLCQETAVPCNLQQTFHQSLILLTIQLIFALSEHYFAMTTSFLNFTLPLKNNNPELDNWITNCKLKSEFPGILMFDVK